MSELRTDEARAPIPPIDPNIVRQVALARGGGATQAASGGDNVIPFNAAGLQAPSAPESVVPNYLQPLITKIKGGESRNRNVLYGGDPVPPGNVIPGSIGPTGQPTHAFSEWQFEPKTWNDAAAAFRQNGWVLNKDNPSDRDRAGLWVARRDYKSKTGRDLDADAQAGKIDEGALHATWTSIRPQYAAAREERYQAGSSELQGIAADTHKIMEEIARTGARDPKMFGMLREARQKMAEYEERALKLTEEGPKNDPRDLMQRMGGVASVIGILGGLLTKQPLMASLNAGASAMEAYNKQDEVAYKANVDQWRYHIDALQKMGKVQHDLIRDTLADERTDNATQMTRLQGMLSALGNERLAEVARLGDERGLRQFQQQMFQSDRQFTLQMRKLDEMQNKPTAVSERLFEDLQKAKDLPPGPERDQAVKDAETAISDHNKAQGKGGSAQGLWSQDAMEALVERAFTGDPTVMQQLPRSGPARQQFEENLAKRLKAEPGGLSGGNSQMLMNRLRMTEAQSAARTAGRVTMNTGLFANEAKIAGAEVVRTSEAFPRTELPRINAAIEAYQRNTGDPRIIAFGLAITQLYNAYGKMSNPTGTGIHDADKERLAGQLDEKLSQGQIRSAVEQIIREGMGVSLSAENAQQEVLRSLMPAGASLPPQAPPQTLPPPGTPGAPTVTPSGVGQVPPAGASDTGVIKYDAQGNRVP